MELGGKLKREEKKIKREKGKQKIWNERFSEELHGKKTGGGGAHFQDGMQGFSREGIKGRLRGK